MTAQVSDTFYFNAEKYDLIGISGTKLFMPQDYGMEPEMMDTGCYRGYYADYELGDDGLRLTGLVIRTSDRKFLPLGGVEPDKIPENSPDEDDFEDEMNNGTRSRNHLRRLAAAGVAQYSTLSLPIPFTGHIRLGNGFIDEFYIHMGHQKPSAFTTVLDFTLEEGKVVAMENRSLEAAAIRGEFQKRFGKKSLMQSIDEAFSLDMDFK